MLNLHDHGPKLCDRLSRRQILQAGGLTALGLSLPELLRGRARAAEQAAALGAATGATRAKSCIVLFLMGGPPQHSTWDPKPDAPAEVRGEFGPIDTNVPGMQICSLLPQMSKHADKLCLLRAVSTGDNAHSSSGYYMLTGTPHIPQNFENANPGAPNDYPNLGAVIRRFRGDGNLPGSVRLPQHIFNTDGSVWPGQDAGFLGRSADPWLFRCQPASPDFHIPEFTLQADVSAERLDSRKALLNNLDHQFSNTDRSGILNNYDRQTQRAFELLQSEQSRQAFDLEQETAATRDRYGRHQFGQSALLARRLVDAGVSLVHVNWFRGPEEPTDSPCWDSHTREAARLKDVLAPGMDQTFSALLEDLHQRGTLDDTLVVCMAEFGRSPRINAAAGRDHWGSVFSVALAGGGIRGGMVHGASDPMGGYPSRGKVQPQDLTATILHCLGYSPETIFNDAQGRPLPASRGHVISEILA